MRNRTRAHQNSIFAVMWTLIIIVLLAVLVWGVMKMINQINRKIDMNLHPQKFSEEVLAASDAYDVPPDVIYAVILTESGFDSEAESHSGAMGLMQLMPDTFDWIAWRLKEDADRERIKEPALNIRYGTYLLSYLYAEFGNWSLVYAAYNAGDGKVKEWLADSSMTDDGELVNIPYKETAAYVKKVTAARDAYLQLYYETQVN